MREIVFDTETTGLDPKTDRIIEIGGVELDNRFPTGRTFHVYINPDGQQVHPDALAVHGISNEDLADKPMFAGVLDEFLNFFEGAKFVAHNAGFDMGFVNAELSRLGQTAIDPNRVVDTLALARRKHPMGPNSLDALCKRYAIDNSHRKLHGALLDAELLAEVYIEMIGGKQAALGLEIKSADPDNLDNDGDSHVELSTRPTQLASRLTQKERVAHTRMVESLGENAIWKKLAL